MYNLGISEEMMRRVSPKERRDIDSNLASLEKVAGYTQAIAKKIHSVQWNTSEQLYTFTKFPYYAWKAFTTAKINRTQLATMLIFFAAYEAAKKDKVTDKIESIPLFIDGNPNPEAVEMLVSTLDKCGYNFTYVTADQFNAFMSKMSRQPLSEQVFLKVKKISDFDSSVAGIIHKKFGFKILLESHGDTQFVPSLGMMQALVDSISDHPVRINPVFGLSEGKDLILNGLHSSRDMLIPFPGVSNPGIADGRPATPIHFVYHDFYHSITSSYIPKEHRIYFIHLTSFLKNKGLSPLVRSLNDMELTHYRPDQRGTVSANAVFWETINYERALLKTQEQKDSAKKEILDFLFTRKFSEKFGINGEGLKEIIAFYKADNKKLTVEALSDWQLPETTASVPLPETTASASLPETIASASLPETILCTII